MNESYWQNYCYSAFFLVDLYHGLACHVQIFYPFYPDIWLGPERFPLREIHFYRTLREISHHLVMMDMKYALERVFQSLQKDL